MPLPGSNKPTESRSEETAAPVRPQARLGKDFVREMPEVGVHQAVLAEIYFDRIAAVAEDKAKGISYRPEHFEIIYIWQLETTYQEDGPMKGKRFVVEDKHFDNVTAKNRHGDMFRSWQGENKPLTDDQLTEWIEMECAVPSPLIGENANLSLTVWEGDNGKRKANVKSVTKIRSAQKPLQVDSDYLPWVERLKKAEEKRNNPNRGGNRSNPPAGKDAPNF